MKISIKHDLHKAARLLDRMGKKQIPFAASVAMNKTAEAMRADQRRKIVRDLDNPTSQVVNSVRVIRSTKRRLTAGVFILDPIAKFLRYQIVGGTRPPRGRTEAVPVNMRLNKYGNIPGRRQGKLAKLLAKPDTFAGTIRGVPGIYQRGRGRMRNRKVKLLAAFERRTRYSPRFHFYRYAADTAARTWPRNFRVAINRALRSAR